MTNVTDSGVTDGDPETEPGGLDQVEDPISANLRRLLALRGIAKHKQVLELSALLNVSRTTVHRKFKGEVAWSAFDLQVIAERFSFPTEQLVGGPAEAPPEAAALRIPKCPATGTIVVGELLDNLDICDLVAVKGLAGWEVYPRALAPSGPPKYAIKSLTMSSPAYVRVAVLEDSLSAAEALSDALKDLGFAVTSFQDTQSFLSNMAGGRFQAYVVDWDLGNQTAEAALNEIRAMEAQAGKEPAQGAPIFVTTGILKDTDGGSAEAALLPICDRLNAAILEKPIRPSVLAAHIRRELGQNAGTH